MSLVTVGDLKAYMDVTFTDNEERAAQMVLEGLQVELETYLRRPVEMRTFRESYIVPADYVPYSGNAPFYDYGDGDNVAIVEPDMMIESYIQSIDNTPVVEVDSVTVTPPGGTATVLTEGGHYIVRKYGLEFFGGVAANSKIDVVYTGGLDGTDIAYFKVLILRAATRETQNMHDDVVGVKDLETRNVAPLETGFTESEKLMLSRWRRRRV